MKTNPIYLAGFLAALFPYQQASAYSRGNCYGGSSSHSYGSSSHSNTFGGSTEHTAGEGTSHESAAGTSTAHATGGGTEHTNAYGGSTEGKYGEGATHTNTYGGTTSGAYGEGAYHTTADGATAYHPPTAYYGYHPPATVNYYGTTCAHVNGWAAAATTAAVVTSAAVSANTAATSGAYNAGYNNGAAAATPPPGAQPASPPAPAGYAVGQTVAILPGSVTSTTTVQGATYYLCGSTWFSPAFGANGVYYRVVAPPGQTPQGAEKVLELMQLLQLTPDQEIAVLPILRAEIPQLEAIKADPSVVGFAKLERLGALRDQYAPQLQAILTEAQYQQLQDILAAEVRKAIQAAVDGN